MFPLKPRSILQLTLSGFLAISCLVGFAMFLAGRQVKTLGNNSQVILTLAVGGLEYVRVISEQSGDMERNARQFLVTRDSNLVSVYADRRQKFLLALDNLSLLNPDRELATLLDQLRQTEIANHDALVTGELGLTERHSYRSILALSRRVGELQGNLALSQLDLIAQESTTMLGFLRLQGILLTSAALVLVTVFTLLITRPLLQLQKAIQQLGSGKFDTKVTVQGPADLVHLGSSLDWLRDRLQKLERHRSAFFRHISHEFKTPLAVIQESSALLIDEVPGTLNARQKNLLQIQSANCQRLQHMIAELLRYQTEIQIGLNKMPQPVRLDRLIDQVIRSHQFSIQLNALVPDVQTVAIEVLGDEEQLRVIIDNLVTNSIKYSPAGGEIRIRLVVEKTELLLDVIDQGPGIPDAEREKIFEAFYLGSIRPEHHDSGSGLGLAIAREYLDMHRGTISVLPSNQGAHFRVSIPV